MQQTYASLILTEAMKLMEEERVRVREQVETSGGIQDYATYLEKVGELRAYRKCLESFEEARLIVEKRT